LFNNINMLQRGTYFCLTISTTYMVRYPLVPLLQDTLKYFPSQMCFLMESLTKGVKGVQGVPFLMDQDRFTRVLSHVRVL
jgi:hypothetical protein